jgi:hypothetical protein
LAQKQLFVVPSRAVSSSSPHLPHPPAQISPAYFATNMLPVGFFMGLTLWSGNAVYLYLTVSFIQILKV